MANSEDTGEKLQQAAFYQGLHHLLRSGSEMHHFIKVLTGKYKRDNSSNMYGIIHQNEKGRMVLIAYECHLLNPLYSDGFSHEYKCNKDVIVHYLF